MHEDFRSLTGSGARQRRRPERGLLRVTGGDRVRFLNGMISNDVALPPGTACYAAQLDRKGHLVADLWVLVLEDAIWLDIAPGRAGAVAELLEKHLIADDVEIEDLSAAWGRLDFEGPDARQIAGAPELEPGEVAIDEKGRVWLAGGEVSDEGVRVFAPHESLAVLLERSAALELSETHAELLRVVRMQPAFGVDMDERSFPAEARLERAISFTKGCYIGQEIVARIHSRGAVNRLLVQLSSDAPVSPGDAITAGGRALGAVTSSAVSATHGPLALGYVKRAFAAPGSEVEIARVAARVVGPPLDA